MPVAEKNQAFQEKLRAALVSPSGRIAAVDRIETELLGPSMFRWTLWERGRRLVSLAGRAADLPGMLAATGVVARMSMGLPPSGQAGRPAER